MKTANRTKYCKFVLAPQNFGRIIPWENERSKLVPLKFVLPGVFLVVQYYGAHFFVFASYSLCRSSILLYWRMKQSVFLISAFAEHLALMFRRTAAASGEISAVFRRRKTTSAQHVAARHRDHTFEKLMDGYKHLIQVLAVQDMILASPDLCIPLPLLSSPESVRLLRFRRGAAHFLSLFPAVFSLRRHPDTSLPALVHLTPAAHRLAKDISRGAPYAEERITRLLCLSSSRSLPLRAIIRVSHELGLPHDFEHSIISNNPNPNPNPFSIFRNPREPNTHLIALASPSPAITPAVDAWRLRQLPDLKNQSAKKSPEKESEIRFAFNHTFPPGMRLTKIYRSRVKLWQKLPYPSPYAPPPSSTGSVRRKGAAEKRAVAVAHEFLSLTVEKMIEVEKFSHFRKSFGIDFNVRDLFLDHPGIFYLSEKGRRHTVFLREAYERGCLIESNPAYEARRKLLHLVLMRKRGAAFVDSEEDEQSTKIGDS